jgi:hypothetical protein
MTRRAPEPGSDDCPTAGASGGRESRPAVTRPGPERPPDAAWLKLGVEPGLCRGCRHAKLNETQRGTAYLRCTRAAWDVAVPRYPRLPVTQCRGFDDGIVEVRTEEDPAPG